MLSNGSQECFELFESAQGTEIVMVFQPLIVIYCDGREARYMLGLSTALSGIYHLGDWV